MGILCGDDSRRLSIPGPFVLPGCLDLLWISNIWGQVLYMPGLTSSFWDLSPLLFPPSSLPLSPSLFPLNYFFVYFRKVVSTRVQPWTSLVLTSDSPDHTAWVLGLGFASLQLVLFGAGDWAQGFVHTQGNILPTGPLLPELYFSFWAKHQYRKLQKIFLGNIVENFKYSRLLENRFWMYRCELITVYAYNILIRLWLCNLETNTKAPVFLSGQFHRHYLCTLTALSLFSVIKRQTWTTDVRI